MADKTVEEIGTEIEGLSKNVHPALTHDEQVRGAALSIACRYYTDTIVKDGNLYRELIRDGKVLKPATYTGVIEVAMAFELFILGKLRHDAAEIAESPESAIARSAAKATKKPGGTSKSKSP